MIDSMEDICNPKTRVYVRNGMVQEVEGDKECGLNVKEKVRLLFVKNPDKTFLFKDVNERLIAKNMGCSYTHLYNVLSYLVENDMVDKKKRACRVYYFYNRYKNNNSN